MRETLRAWLIVAVMVAVSLGIMVMADRAEAKAVRLEPPVRNYEGRSPVLYVEHVQRRWFYVELADGSTWMVTRCRHEDSNNCWWNAEKRGNGGRSFVVIKRHYHLLARGGVVR